MTAGDVQWMTAGSGILHQEMPKGDANGPHARLPAVGQPARVAEDDRPALSGHSRRARFPRSPKTTAPRRASSAASSGASAGRWRAWPPIRSYVDISVPPGKRKRIKVETTRNAFAYVFAGAGTFRDASDPQAVLTESAVDPNAPPVYDAKNHSLVLFDRGDEIVVQAGPGGHPLPARFRQAARGAGGVVRAHRDEHPGRAAAGDAASCRAGSSSATDKRLR